MPPNLRSLIDRNDKLADRLKVLASQADLSDQFVFSNVLVLRAGGLVEESVTQIISLFAETRSSLQIKNFIVKKISWMNSMNCEKIKSVLCEFDESWWGQVESRAGQDCLTAIDSIKTIRDQIAHGRHNGTGISTVHDYYVCIKKFPIALNEVVLK